MALESIFQSHSKGQGHGQVAGGVWECSRMGAPRVHDLSWVIKAAKLRSAWPNARHFKPCALLGEDFKGISLFLFLFGNLQACTTVQGSTPTHTFGCTSWLGDSATGGLTRSPVGGEAVAGWLGVRPGPACRGLDVEVRRATGLPPGQCPRRGGRPDPYVRAQHT